MKDSTFNESYIEYVKFQIDELTKASLRVGEDEELESKLKVLCNSEKINKIMNLAMDSLKYSEQNSVNTILMNVIKLFRSIDSISGEIKDVTERLEGIYYDLESIFDDIKLVLGNVDFDFNEFDAINSRIYFINSDLITYNEELKNYLDRALNQESILEELKHTQEELYEKLCVEADNITEVRREYSERIENEIVSELNYMGMENITFKTNLSKSLEFSQIGNDNVEFLISTNKGEPLKNLSKIVSGGELSRIMLALKIVFIGSEPISGIIFDEIDTGVSGKIAQRVGEKMYYLSSRCQVFCITHIPQIASLSDNHYLVTKKIKDEKTISDIKIINYDEKISEIAKMIGGENVTESAFLSAKELIGNKKIVE